MKEDLLQSIKRGSVHDVQVIDQKVEGGLISMSVTAVVDPEEIKSLFEKRIAENRLSSRYQPNRHLLRIRL